VLDARRGEVYAAGFSAGRGADWLPEGVVPIAALGSCLPAGCRIVGEGVALCTETLRAATWSSCRLPIPRRPRGTSPRSRPGVAARRDGRGGDLAPRYLRRAEAEVKRTGQRFEPL
jgi:hypothetical protein